MKVMTAKYKGKCYSCDVQVKVGDPIEWVSAGLTKHVNCELACEQQTDADKRAKKRITQLGDFTGVYAMFELAAKGGKWPRITINADGYEFYIYVSGAKAVLPNVLNVKHPGGNGLYDDWFGRITIDGVWDQRHKEVDERMADALSKLAMDPIGTVAMYGRLSGKCCFCKKQLTDAPSVDAGYGPVCAKRWGLAWGGKPGMPYVMSKMETGKSAWIVGDEHVANPPHVVVGSFIQNGTAYSGPVQEYGVIDEITDETVIAAIKKTKAEWDETDETIELDSVGPILAEPIKGPFHDVKDELAPSECEFCYDTKLVDGEACLDCAPVSVGPTLAESIIKGHVHDVSKQWSPESPLDIWSLLKMVEADAAAPKETVIIHTKEIVAEVNIPKEFQFKGSM